MADFEKGNAASVPDKCQRCICKACLILDKSRVGKTGIKACTQDSETCVGPYDTCLCHASANHD